MVSGSGFEFTEDLKMCLLARRRICHGSEEAGQDNEDERPHGRWARRAHAPEVLKLYGHEKECFRA